MQFAIQYHFSISERQICNFLHLVHITLAIANKPTGQEKLGSSATQSSATVLVHCGYYKQANWPRKTLVLVQQSETWSVLWLYCNLETTYSNGQIVNYESNTTICSGSLSMVLVAQLTVWLGALYSPWLTEEDL